MNAEIKRQEQLDLVKQAESAREAVTVKVVGEMKVDIPTKTLALALQAAQHYFEEVERSRLELSARLEDEKVEMLALQAMQIVETDVLTIEMAQVQEEAIEQAINDDIQKEKLRKQEADRAGKSTS